MANEEGPKFNPVVSPERAAFLKKQMAEQDRKKASAESPGEDANPIAGGAGSSELPPEAAAASGEIPPEAVAVPSSEVPPPAQSNPGSASGAGANESSYTPEEKWVLGGAWGRFIGREKSRGNAEKDESGRWRFNKEVLERAGKEMDTELEARAKYKAQAEVKKKVEAEKKKGETDAEAARKKIEDEKNANEEKARAEAVTKRKAEVGRGKGEKAYPSRHELEELYESFYGSYSEGKRIAPRLSPFIEDMEERALRSGVRRDDIEALREEVMKRTGYWDLLPREKKPISSPSALAPKLKLRLKGLAPKKGGAPLVIEPEKITKDSAGSKPTAEPTEPAVPSLAESASPKPETGVRPAKGAEKFPKTPSGKSPEAITPPPDIHFPEGGDVIDRGDGVPPPEKPREAPPARTPEERKKEKLVFLTLAGAIEQTARDMAAARMTAGKKEGSQGVSGWAKRVWKYNWWYEYYRQKEVGKAKKEIEKARSLLIGETKDPKAHEAEMRALLKRFSADFDDVIHREAGETREVLGESEGDRRVKAEVQNLIREYASGKIDDANFQEARNRIFSEVTGVPREEVDKQVGYADNLFEFARQARQSVDHGLRLEELDLDFQIIRGQAKAGVRTEAELNRVDRLVDRIKSSKVGPWVNETTIATAVSLAYSATAGFSKRIASNRALAWGTYGAAALAGAVFAGAAESKRYKEDRRQHAREMAMGKRIPEGAKRRLEMDRFRYETEDAHALTAALEDGMYERDAEGNLKLRTLNEGDIHQTMARLADMYARVGMSDRHRIDLISFSDARTVETERTAMDLAMARAKVDLRAHLGSGGIALPGGKSFDDYLESLTKTRFETLTSGEGGLKEKNRLFEKARRVNVAKAMGKALITGLVVGGAAQEVGAFLRENQEGLIEGLVKGHKQSFSGTPHFTVAEYLRRYLTGDMPRFDPSKVHEFLVGTNRVTLPEGVELVNAGNQTYRLVRDGTVLSEGITFDHNDRLSPESIKMLRGAGIVTTETIDQVTGSARGAITDKDFVAGRPNLFQRIYRDLWYDNDTPKPIFDKNELRLRWGGLKGTGIDANGNFVFNVKHMMKDGSYHKQFSADAQELMKQGKLKILLSVSVGTQNQVCEVLIDQNGDAIIERNTEIGKALFREVKGRAEYLGRFAEVAEMRGAKDGAEHVRILATHEGKGLDTIIDTVPKAVEIPRTLIDVPADYRVDAPPFIPVVGRRPLETMGRRREGTPYGGYGPEGVWEREREQFYRERMSPALRENPGAVLDFKRENERYFDHERAEDPDYMEDLEKLLRQRGMRTPMHESCRAAICIPVYDLGEGKIIEHALEQYRKQIENGSIRPEEFEIILFLNHPKDRRKALAMKRGARRRVRLGKPEEYDTEEVIRQYQKRYPEMPIRVMKKEFPTRQQWGEIIKYAYDAAMRRASQREYPNRDDIILITNDIDVRDMSPQYLRDIIRTFDQNEAQNRVGMSPRLDGVVGRIDHDPETYKEWPNFFAATRFDQFIDAQNRRGYRGTEAPRVEGEGYVIGNRVRGEQHVITQGRNTALRGSTYCAIGGANRGTDAGADTELGGMVRMARRGSSGEALGPDRYPISYRTGVWLETDPRREIGMYKKGQPIAWAWNEWDKMDIYGKTFLEQIEGDEEDLNQKRLEDEFRETMKKWNLEADSLEVRRALGWLGFAKSDYAVVTERGEDGKERKMMKIKNVVRLKERLNKWKPRKERPRAA